MRFASAKQSFVATWGHGWVRREPNPAAARANELFLPPQVERISARTAAVQAAVVAAMTDAESETTLR